jgi:hypothetical protein
LAEMVMLVVAARCCADNCSEMHRIIIMGIMD